MFRSVVVEIFSCTVEFVCIQDSIRGAMGKGSASNILTVLRMCCIYKLSVYRNMRWDFGTKNP